MDIQTDSDYIKRVVHGPSGDHTLKETFGFAHRELSSLTRENEQLQ